jgi:succinate dehydrogenase/fumarate reductase flavoprotein subunit
MSLNDCETLDASAVENWHDECDVLVIGFGAAGACAALESREAGADVLVLERASGISGTTCAATGHFYLGGGTRVQLANDIDDSVEAMFNYLMANTPEPEEEKIRAYCEDSVGHFNWLVAQGVPFNDGFYKLKHYEQPTDECLIWSGNEKAWPFNQKAAPAPRGHKVEKVGSEGGGLVMEKLTTKAEELGVRFSHDANVKNLVLDNSSVVGVRYTCFKEERFVRARKGVVIAAGGFAMNQEMLEEHCPRLGSKNVFKQGNPNDDGAGIRMGVAAGGKAIHMEGALITAPFYPPESLLKGILVNKNGERFINEDSYHARTMSACYDQPEGVAYLIADNATFGRPEIQMQELIDAWETVEEMEADLELPTGSLQKTLANYNENAAKEEDPEFHKYPDWLVPLDEAPYAALQCSVGKSVYVGFTLGGLQVSVDAEVLDAGTGEPVPGLYAAGACASNIAQDGAGYSSGTCIGESTYFGRRAGRHVAGLS